VSVPRPGGGQPVKQQIGQGNLYNQPAQLWCVAICNYLDHVHAASKQAPGLEGPALDLLFAKTCRPMDSRNLGEHADQLGMREYTGCRVLRMKMLYHCTDSIFISNTLKH
jgi:hypothetical protein